jgi:hypothetical protein
VEISGNIRPQTGINWNITGNIRQLNAWKLLPMWEKVEKKWKLAAITVT